MLLTLQPNNNLLFFFDYFLQSIDLFLKHSFFQKKLFNNPLLIIQKFVQMSILLFERKDRILLFHSYHLPTFMLLNLRFKKKYLLVMLSSQIFNLPDFSVLLDLHFLL